MSKKLQPAISLAVTERREDVVPVIAGTLLPPPIPLWKPGTAEVVQLHDGREALMVELSKLDPRVKFVTVYLDWVKKP